MISDTYNRFSAGDKDGDKFDEFLSLKREFHSVIVPDTQKKINELIADADPEMKRQARAEYLKGKMQETIEDAIFTLDRFHDYLHRGRTLEAILERETLDGLIKIILKLQGEIISLRKSGNTRGITEDEIRRAKEYPFTNLHEFKNKMALCPFHSDKHPSMHLFQDNHVYCFSCARGWDTIAFVMQRDGLSFVEAIKKLC